MTVPLLLNPQGASSFKLTFPLRLVSDAFAYPCRMDWRSHGRNMWVMFFDKQGNTIQRRRVSITN